MSSRFMTIVLRFTNYPFLYAFGIGAYALAASAQVGHSLGLHNLFLEDAGAPPGFFFGNRPSFNTQLALSLSVAFAWFVPVFASGDIDDGTLEQKARRLAIEELPWALGLNLVLFALVLFSQCAVIEDAASRSNQIWYSFAGLPAGLLVAAFILAVALGLAHVLGVATVRAFIGCYAAIIIVVLVYPLLIPAVCLSALFTLITLAYVVVKLLPVVWRIPAVASFLALLVVGFNLAPKSELPGITDVSGKSSYKVAPVILPIKTIPPKGRRLATARVRSPLPGSVAPLDALDAWKASLGGRQPKLVVVATTGGAYRASFWTTLVLDRIVALSAPGGPHLDLHRSIRLLTGASGGVVGAAYFAATLTPPGAGPEGTDLTSRLTADIKTAQGRYPQAQRDSLSSVAQQWIQTDIPASFLPWIARPDRDRGVVLEENWKALYVTFSELAAGERAGWRPSMIISPMDINTGAPVLISNLDLDEVIEEDTRQVEFFRIYPAARKSFALRTAVRMSATFPYVSPIVELPTNPPVRVVDAGYYDNYGMSTAVGFLRAPPIMKWLSENVSGIMVIQIRTSGTTAPGKRDAAPGTVSCKEGKSDCKGADDGAGRSGPFSWLTGPLEGASAGRELSMRVRNDQELEMLQGLYARDFVQTVIFRNTVQSSASWSLPNSEFSSFVEELKSEDNEAAFADLQKWWRGEVVGSR